MHYFYFCMQIAPGLCMFVGKFPLISVWPFDPKEDVTAVQMLLIKCFVVNQTLLFSCTDVIPPPQPPSAPLSSPSSTALRVGISCLFLWKQIPEEEWMQLCIFLFVFGGMVFEVFLVVARSDWIVYVGRAAGEGNTLEEKKNTQRAFFPLICPQTLSLRHLDPGCKQLKCFAREQAGLCAETESCLWGWRVPLWTNPIGCV